MKFGQFEDFRKKVDKQRKEEYREQLEQVGMGREIWPWKTGSDFGFLETNNSQPMCSDCIYKEDWFRSSFYRKKHLVRNIELDLREGP